MLIAQTFCNIHFIYVWNCKNSRCYKKLQLLLDQSRLAVLLILFFFGQKKSFLWQIWQKRLLWLKSILCNHNSGITLLSAHEIIHATGAPVYYFLEKIPVILIILCSCYKAVLWGFFKKIHCCWVIWSKDNLASCSGLIDEKSRLS